MSTDPLTQLAASGPVGVVAVLVIYALIKVFNKFLDSIEARLLEKEKHAADLRAEVEKRVIDAKSYGELLSLKDKEIQAEKERRIGDAQLYAKTHAEITKESYKFEESFTQLSDLITERIKIAYAKDKDEEERYRNALEQHVRQNELAPAGPPRRATVRTGPQRPYIPPRPGDDDNG